MTTTLRKTLGLWDLVLMNIVAIVGLRWLLTAAQTGTASVSLWLLALVFFFIPQGLTLFHLSRINPNEGGIYLWARDAFGPFHGFVTGWCYWINNLIYYPTLLMFVGGNALYIFGSRWLHLNDSSLYIVLFSLITLWLILLLNIRGMSIGKWFHNLGGIGTWIPILLLIVMAAIHWESTESATAWNWHDLIPDFGRGSTWAFWSTMCFGFAGLELMSVLGGEIKSPERSIPKAIVISGIGIALIYILGTMALLVALPKDQVGLLDGIVGAVQNLSVSVFSTDLVWIAALFITVSGLGGISAWIAGVARIPFVIGLDSYLPTWLGDLHPKWGTPYKSLIAQGALTSFFILFSIAGSTIREAYLVLLDAEIILYFIPYLYMFAAGWKVSADKPKFKYAAGIGFITTLLAMIFAVIPPEGTSALSYELKIWLVTIGFVGAGLILYQRRNSKFRAPGVSEWSPTGKSRGTL